MRSSILTLIDEAPALLPPRRNRTLALRLRAGQPQSSLSPGLQAFEIVPTDSSVRLEEASVITNSHPRRNSPRHTRLPIARRCFVIREYPTLSEISHESASPRNSKPQSDLGRAFTLADAERQHSSKVVEMINGLIEGKGGAAEVLGVPPSTLRNRMKKLASSLKALVPGSPGTIPDVSTRRIFI